jgi:signal transduction histidine kinase
MNGMVPAPTGPGEAEEICSGGKGEDCGEGQRVLIVDDEQESLNLLHRTLRGLYETSLARDGREGLRCLERNPAAVVIADQRMPGMTGVEFLAEASQRFPYTQRILLTGYTEVEGLVEAINAGHVFGYLSKPWHPDDLLATLRRAVETHRLLREKDRLLEDLQQTNQELRRVLEQTRQLEAEKIQAERWAALGRLAGMIAHDLRNPLAAIRCHAGLLQDADLGDGGQDRSLRAILDQVQSMGHYIHELLLFAKPEDSGPACRPYALSALVASLQEAFAQRCEGKGVRLETRLGYRGVLWIRPPQIYRVLENLLQNALDAAAQGGRILVVSETVNSKEIVIRVADSGAGIDGAIRERLFEPFVTLGKPGGTGLGLAIVRKIVCEHGGRVWEDPWELKGACFHVVLRREPPEDRERASQPAGC